MSCLTDIFQMSIIIQFKAFGLFGLRITVNSRNINSEKTEIFPKFHYYCYFYYINKIIYLTSNLHTSSDIEL